MTGKYDYEIVINYFQHITQEFVDDWWFGIKYRIIDDNGGYRYGNHSIYG